MKNFNLFLNTAYEVLNSEGTNERYKKGKLQALGLFNNGPLGIHFFFSIFDFFLLKNWGTPITREFMCTGSSPLS